MDGNGKNMVKEMLIIVTAPILVTSHQKELEKSQLRCQGIGKVSLRPMSSLEANDMRMSFARTGV